MEPVFALLITLLICLVLGIPIAFSIGIATLVALFIGDIPYNLLAQGAFTSLDSFTTMAIPFFILAGALMEKGGLSDRLINLAQNIVGNVTGGFGMVTVIGCAFFAAISGSSPATVAAIGSIMIPAMVNRGYSKEFAAATAATAGGLGVVIPPSVTMIIFAISANASVTDMFIAGIGPGVLIVIMLCFVIYLIARKRSYSGTGIPFNFKSVLSAFWNAKWALLAPVIILGGIYSGIFTATESAVVAVIYGFIIGMFVYKELKWRHLPTVITQSATITGAVVIILGTATTFGRVITMYQVPHHLTNWLTSIFQDKYVILLMIALLVLILGTFMETLSIIVILTPILIPIVVSLGINPIHFGMIMVIGAEIGMMTPPVGVNLFVASGISGLSIERISIGMIPFLITMLLVYLIIIFYPPISIGLIEMLK